MKWIVSVTSSGRQLRINIPKYLVKAAGLESERYLALEMKKNGRIEIRRVEIEKNKRPGKDDTNKPGNAAEKGNAVGD